MSCSGDCPCQQRNGLVLEGDDLRCIQPPDLCDVCDGQICLGPGGLVELARRLAAMHTDAPSELGSVDSIARIEDI